MTRYRKLVKKKIRVIKIVRHTDARVVKQALMAPGAGE